MKCVNRDKDDGCYPQGMTFDYGNYGFLCMNHYLQVCYYSPHPRVARQRGDDTFIFRGVEVPTTPQTPQMELFNQ